ncbi:hypothetical protein [Paenibacillus rhizophilus]|nr:hypothetical protein [Paenibacillus rhizophilus]
MSMYKSHVIAGRILEIRDDHVLTQQGDVICSYHSRYYLLPDEEAWTETLSNTQDLPDTPLEPLNKHHRFMGIGKRWNIAIPRFLHMKKSANRI